MEMAYVQLTDNDDAICIKEVQNEHIQLLEAGADLNSDDAKLIGVLGGIDMVLTHCLSNDNPYNLDKKQLLQIKEIINNKLDNNTKSVVNNIESVNEHKTTLYLSPNDTILHFLFGEVLANKLINIMFSKPMIIYIFFSGCFVMTEYLCWIIFTANLHRTVPSVLYDLWTITWILLFLYSIICFLCLNIKSLSKIVMTFDFMMKTLYAIRMVACNAFLRYQTFDAVNHGSTYWVRFAFCYCTVIVIIIIFSSIDGFYQMSYKLKTLYGFIIAINLSIMAVYNVFVGESKHQHQINMFNNELTLNISSLYAESLAILAFFLWKQTLKLVVNRHHKETATLITESVQIIWMNTNS